MTTERFGWLWSHQQEGVESSGLPLVCGCGQDLDPDAHTHCTRCGVRIGVPSGSRAA